jgi:hypothetical protein
MALILLAVIPLQTAGLEQAKAPISDWYFVLVLPMKVVEKNVNDR